MGLWPIKIAAEKLASVVFEDLDKDEWDKEPSRSKINEYWAEDVLAGVTWVELRDLVLGQKEDEITVDAIISACDYFKRELISLKESWEDSHIADYDW